MFSADNTARNRRPVLSRPVRNLVLLRASLLGLIFRCRVQTRLTANGRRVAVTGGWGWEGDYGASAERVRFVRNTRGVGLLMSRTINKTVV